MKTLEKVNQNVADSKDIQRMIKKHRKGCTENQEVYNNMFISHANRYIKAIKEGRMNCVIHSVSASGMSRTISFHECAKNDDGKYQYLQFCMLFDLLGYTPSKKNNFRFVIGGCGMDMVFHTNYTIIHKLHRLGFIDKKECDKLAQMTPTIL